MQGKSKHVFFKLSVTISDLEYFFAIHWTLVKIADDFLQNIATFLEWMHVGIYHLIFVDPFTMRM